MKAFTNWGVASAASFAAAAVLLSASPACAEERAAEFETEFELDAAPAVAVHEATVVRQAAATELATADNKLCLDGACPLSTASSWETAISQYLDALLETAKETQDVLVGDPEGAETEVLTVEELSSAAPGFEPVPAIEAAVVEETPDAVAVDAAAVIPQDVPPCDLNKLAAAGGWHVLAKWSAEHAEAVTRALQHPLSE